MLQISKLQQQNYYNMNVVSILSNVTEV